jgi:hypothetical protein
MAMSVFLSTFTDLMLCSSPIAAVLDFKLFLLDCFDDMSGCRLKTELASESEWPGIHDSPIVVLLSFCEAFKAVLRSDLMNAELSLERLRSLRSHFEDAAFVDLVGRADFLVAAGDFDFRLVLLVFGVLVTSLPILFTDG